MQREAPRRTRYDAVIIGAGHNGLVAACYLARAGLSVLLLEKNPDPGGATRSARPFPEFDARLSVYSYLVSLLPEQIIADLGLKLALKSRRTSSWTPGFSHSGAYEELLLRNGDAAQNREAFRELTGGESDYRGWMKLQEWQSQIAGVFWPSLTEPMASRETMRRRLGKTGRQAWEALIENPVGEAIEKLICHDLIRGVVATDARIGLPAHPRDPSLMANRCFLYHVIGQGTGEWRVPAGGMGSLTGELLRVAAATGHAEIVTGAEVKRILPGDRPAVVFSREGNESEVEARFVLCNASAQVLERLTGSPQAAARGDVEGTAFKMNLLLQKLPALLSDRCTAAEAFAGTVHIDEGYSHMIACHEASQAGIVPERPPGEIYCHTLTDPSILSPALNEQGFHTLTLFGLDMPCRLFEKDNAALREEVSRRYLAGINRYLREPIEECLARDSAGRPCLEAMSALDLEQKLALPRGNIFHGSLDWPFAESEDEAGQWGVETECQNILICGSSARRGGAVSGIPGRNAAMKVLEMAKAEKG